MSQSPYGTIQLPGSKSESNRALMMAAYGGFPLEVDNLSEAYDTVLLKTLLEQQCAVALPNEVVVDCKDGGTVARFLMTYLAGKPGNWLLTGTRRLCQRPMAPLVDALRQLGADITCIESPGCLPARIHGKHLEGGCAELDISLSSQFASSLLLAAPTWEKGLQLSMKGNPVSEPYLAMTVEMMRHFGIHVDVQDSNITIDAQQYQPRRFSVEADWSAASYWYEMMALGKGGSLLLKGLAPKSIQGDSVVAEMFRKLGVDTQFVTEGALVSKTGNAPSYSKEPVVFDFHSTPDLFPSVFVTCVALNHYAVFKGIATLSKKESDRINSLITELYSIYTFINIVSYDEVVIYNSSINVNAFDINKIVFNTYQDHRIAMSVAALQPLFGRLTMDDPSVVNKSYPTFWEEFNKAVLFIK